MIIYISEYLEIVIQGDELQQEVTATAHTIPSSVGSRQEAADSATPSASSMLISHRESSTSPARRAPKSPMEPFSSPLSCQITPPGHE